MAVHVTSTEFFGNLPPKPYASVPVTELAHLRKEDKEMKLRPLRHSLVTVDGLRLLALDGIGSAPYWGDGRWHDRDLTSSSELSGSGPTLLHLSLLAPATHWQASQPLLNAILASMRLSRPTGGWPGS